MAREIRNHWSVPTTYSSSPSHPPDVIHRVSKYSLWKSYFLKRKLSSKVCDTFKVLVLPSPPSLKEMLKRLVKVKVKENTCVNHETLLGSYYTAADVP